MSQFAYLEGKELKDHDRDLGGATLEVWGQDAPMMAVYFQAQQISSHGRAYWTCRDAFEAHALATLMQDYIVQTRIL